MAALSQKDFIGKIYEPIEKLYIKGFWEWLYGNPHRRGKFDIYERQLNEAMKERAEPWPEGHAYQNCLIEFLSEYGRALTKAKSLSVAERIGGRLGQAE